MNSARHHERDDASQGVTRGAASYMLDSAAGAGRQRGEQESAAA